MTASFLDACRDLAEQALDRQPDPADAMRLWRGLSAMQAFDAPLLAFLTAVAKDREGQRKAVTQIACALPPATEDDHTHADPRNKRIVPVTGEPASGGRMTVDTHRSSAPARGPTQTQIDAVTRAKETSARVMSGVYITERQGGRTRVEDITVASLARRLRWLGRHAAQRAVEYNTIYLIHQHTGRQAFIPDNAVVGGILNTSEIQRLHEMAKAFAASPMVQLPDALRSEIAA